MSQPLRFGVRLGTGTLLDLDLDQCLQWAPEGSEVDIGVHSTDHARVHQCVHPVVCGWIQAACASALLGIRPRAISNCRIS